MTTIHVGIALGSSGTLSNNVDVGPENEVVVAKLTVLSLQVENYRACLVRNVNDIGVGLVVVPTVL